MFLPLLSLFLAALPGTAPSPSFRLESSVFGQRMEIAVYGLPAEPSRTAIEAAFAEAAEIERLADLSRPDGALIALNAAAGQGPQTVDPRLMAILVHAQDFCSWSEGAHGPLGRDLYRIWGLRSPAPPAAPPPEPLLQATAAAACDRLRLDVKTNQMNLAAGSGLDLWGFAEGQAVDRAAEVLRQLGVRNALVRVGEVYRAFGGGPEGKGWPVLLPRTKEAGEGIFLRDQSLAIAETSERPITIGSETLPPYLNQRTGQPARGVLATFAVTEFAIDARPLSVALLITGPREGQLRIGSLRPRPSVLWLLGSGVSSGASLGSPLRVVYRWSEITKR